MHISDTERASLKYHLCVLGRQLHNVEGLEYLAFQAPATIWRGLYVMKS